MNRYMLIKKISVAGALLGLAFCSTVALAQTHVSPIKPALGLPLQAKMPSSLLSFNNPGPSLLESARPSCDFAMGLQDQTINSLLDTWTNDGRPKPMARPNCNFATGSNELFKLLEGNADQTETFWLTLMRQKSNNGNLLNSSK